MIHLGNSAYKLENIKIWKAFGIIRRFKRDAEIARLV